MLVFAINALGNTFGEGLQTSRQPSNTRTFEKLMKKVVKNSLFLALSLSVITAIFPRPQNTALAGFVEAKDDGSGGDNWNYKSCKAPVKSSPPTN